MYRDAPTPRRYPEIIDNNPYSGRRTPEPERFVTKRTPAAQVETVHVDRRRLALPPLQPVAESARRDENR
ncbi:hypothetical protein BRD06_10325 [Halobacteriales archaeon QS_9_67_15]|nr:MAG: hypothetical protein BRD06_10325 [Halobacteriales archaeon QS_9_67_15]